MYRLMIVDDREIFRRQFKRFKPIKESNYFDVAYEAGNGVEALQILRKNQIDVVITDIRMPIKDGLELLSDIKKEKLCDCVIILSEYADFSYAKEGIVLGAFDYWVKPIMENKLTEDLERLYKYLEERKDELTITIPELTIVSKAILLNDQCLREILIKIYNRVIEVEDDKTIIMCNLQNIYMKRIVPAILNQQPILEDYIVFERYRCREEEPAFNFVSHILALTEEIKHFAISSSHYLVQNICNDILTSIESNISLEAFAEKYHISKTYLSYLFKKEVGNSFIKYVTEVKMARAKVLMMDNSMKIYEISERLGFEDTEYFSRIFKNTTGVTPTIYRRNDYIGDQKNAL